MKRYAKTYSQFILNESKTNEPLVRTREFGNGEVSIIVNEPDIEYAQQISEAVRRKLVNKYDGNMQGRLKFLQRETHQGLGTWFMNYPTEDESLGEIIDIGVFPIMDSEELNAECVIDGILPSRVNYDPDSGYIRELIPAPEFYFLDIYSRFNGERSHDIALLLNEVEKMIETTKRWKKSKSLFGI